MRCLAFVCALAVAVPGLVRAGECPASTSAKKDIVDTAAGAENLKTLVAAVKAADLVEALKGKGPFTVFAPTDEAFAKLPKGTVEDLLKPENKDKLVSILTYHVVPGSFPAKDALAAGQAKTLQGSTVHIMVKDGQPMVNNAKIIVTDVMTSNGVVHIIDTVIMPKK